MNIICKNMLSDPILIIFNKCNTFLLPFNFSIRKGKKYKGKVSFSLDAIKSDKSDLDFDSIMTHQ